MNIPMTAVEAAARAIANATDHHRGFIGTVDAARIALEAAAPHIAAQAWSEGYGQGIQDEQSADAAGLFEFGCRIGPNRANPYE